MSVFLLFSNQSQEIKVNEEQKGFLTKEYPYQYWLPCTVKKGYAGSAVLSKFKPKNVIYEIPGFEGEGRTITLEYEDFMFIASYVPNSGLSTHLMDRYEVGEIAA